jgi:uncharacterized protein (TIGR02646 family)
MIRIRKRSVIPTSLTTLGTNDLARLQSVYIADPLGCQAPRNKLLKIDPDIYGHPDVKTALIEDQYEKCCYCEAKFIANGFGDVEHFRPKGGVRQDRRSNLEKPGYYWLAYSWDNLFFSCEVCNRRYKRNWFPLFNPAFRARHHGQSVSRERALLLNPSQTNPGRYLKFNKHVVTVNGVNHQSAARGKACIRAYGLDRAALNRKREEFLKTVKYARFVSSLDLNTMSSAELHVTLSDLSMTLQEAHAFIIGARQAFNEAAFDKSEYAGMIRDNFPRLPHR